jgi:hypothetical protein
VNLTTRDRVKRRADIQGDKQDLLIDELVAEVSADVETFLGRHIVATARTEVYRLHAHQHTFSVKGAPITDQPTLKYHMRDLQWADVGDQDTTQFHTDRTRGQVYLRFNTPYSPGYAQIVYTGGMIAEDADPDAQLSAFIAAYPQLAGAVDQQVVEILRRRRNPTGSLSVRGSSVVNQGELGLLRDVRRRLDQFRRRRW